MGGAAGDRGRELDGYVNDLYTGVNGGGDGVFYYASNLTDYLGGSIPDHMRYGQLFFTSSRVVPTGPVNTPRSWAALACCYLGHPATV